MMVIFWAAVIGFVWWLAREMRTGSGNRKEMDAMEILKQRYAKGEITKKEFEERKKTLCE